MDKLTSRFVEAYKEIEKWMRKKLNVPPKMPFYELVDLMAEKHETVQRHSELLKMLGRLRNLVIHEYSRNKPVTLPTIHSVEQITTLRDQLLSPPSLLSVSKHPVVCCRPADPVGQAAQKMHDGSYSQLPVYEEDKFLGLLTAETVARWLASSLASGDGIFLEMSVADVQQHREDPENFVFLSRTSTVLEGLAAFDDFLRRGKRLDAILLTHNGCKTEKLLGIVTIHNIPELRQAIKE